MNYRVSAKQLKKEGSSLFNAFPKLILKTFVAKLKRLFKELKLTVAEMSLFLIFLRKSLRPAKYLQFYLDLLILEQFCRWSPIFDMLQLLCGASRAFGDSYFWKEVMVSSIGLDRSWNYCFSHPLSDLRSMESFTFFKQILENSFH